MKSAGLLAVVLSFLYRLVHRAFGALKLARRDVIARSAAFRYWACRTLTMRAGNTQIALA